MHIGIVTLDLKGHLNPAVALGSALLKRGHDVTLICSPSDQAKEYAAKGKLQFAAIHTIEYENGTLEKDRMNMENAEGGLDILHYGKIMMLNQLMASIRDLPSVLHTHQIDAVLADEVCFGIPSIIEANRKLWGTFASALSIIHYNDSSVPLYATTFQYNSNLNNILYRIRNKIIWTVYDQLIVKPIRDKINDYREQEGLPRNPNQFASSEGCIQLSQTPSFLEYPNEGIPNHFYCTCPWKKLEDESIKTSTTKSVDFPYERLNGKPIVYVSLGSWLGAGDKNARLYYNATEACVGLENDVQLILTLGRKGATIDLSDIPEDAIVVDYAPQLEILQKASVIVSHCGLNTTLETLACGKPIVAVPIGLEQPGVASRLVYYGAGVIVSSLTPNGFRNAIVEVLNNPTYQENAEKLQSQFKCLPTMDQTAELIEVAFQQGSPLDRQDPKAMNILGDYDAFPGTTPSF